MLSIENKSVVMLNPCGMLCHLQNYFGVKAFLMWLWCVVPLIVFVVHIVGTKEVKGERFMSSSSGEVMSKS